MKKITLLTLLLIGCTPILQAQAPAIEWQYMEDDVDSEVGPLFSYVAKSVITTTDNHYIIAGTKTNYQDYMGSFLVRKINAAGELVWETDLSPQGIYGEGFAVVAAGGGYIVAGNYYNADFSEVYYALIKLDAEGQFISMLQVPNPVGTSEYHVSKMIVSSDGNLVLAGVNRITKMDTAGNVIWNTSLGNNVLYFINDLIQTTDGNYAIAGKNSGADGSQQNMIWRINADGTPGVQNYYGDAYQNNSSSLLAAPDGGIIFAGSSHTGVGNHGIEDDFWVAEINADNEVVWDQSYGGAGKDLAHHISRTADGGYVLTGKTTSADGDLDDQPLGAQDIWVVKISGAGTVEWQKRLGVSNEGMAEYGSENAYNAGLSVLQTPGQGYVVTGYTAAYTEYSVDGNRLAVYKLKSALDGTLSLSQEINSCDGTFSPVVTLANSGIVEITTAEINYLLDEASAQTFSWAGSLAIGGTVEITLPEQTAAVGTHTFRASISGINEVAYNDEANGGFIEEFRINRYETETVALSLQLDDFPEETTWTLKDSEGTTLYSGGPYSIQGSTVNETFDLDPNDCYTFTINDSNSDGIVSGTDGFYRLTTAENEVFAENGDFDATESVNFFIVTSMGTEGTDKQLFTLYPNPVTDVLHISASEGSVVKDVSVYNMTGQKVYTGQPVNAQMDLYALASGVYFVKVVDSEDNSATYKVVKK